MKNPYKRLRELTLTSQIDFAEKYGFAKTTMTYAESGQYQDLSDALILALGQECSEKHVDAASILFEEYNAQKLQDAYHAWQSIERMQVAHLFQQPPSLYSSTEVSPFQTFIIDTTVSTQGFCKALKLHSGTVIRYATGRTKTMPLSIQEALAEVHFKYTKELTQAQEDWRSGR